MFIKAIARNLWRTGEGHRYATWYEPLDEQAAIGAAVAFALTSDSGDRDRARRATCACCRSMIEAERRASHATAASIAAELDGVPGLEPPFLRDPRPLDPRLARAHRDRPVTASTRRDQGTSATQQGAAGVDLRHLHAQPIPLDRRGERTLLAWSHERDPGVALRPGQAHLEAPRTGATESVASS